MSFSSARAIGLMRLGGNLIARERQPGPRIADRDATLDRSPLRHDVWRDRRRAEPGRVLTRSLVVGEEEQPLS